MQEDVTQHHSSGASSDLHLDKSLGDGLRFTRLLRQLEDPVKAEVTNDSNGNFNVRLVGSGNPNLTLALTTSSLSEVLNVLQTCLDLLSGSSVNENIFKYCVLSATRRSLLMNAWPEIKEKNLEQ